MLKPQAPDIGEVKRHMDQASKIKCLSAEVE